jgi:hypothetical protein
MQASGTLGATDAKQDQFQVRVGQTPHTRPTLMALIADYGSGDLHRRVSSGNREAPGLGHDVGRKMLTTQPPMPVEGC